MFLICKILNKTNFHSNKEALKIPLYADLLLIWMNTFRHGFRFRRPSCLRPSFIFIHFLMNENDKTVPLIICEFHTKCGRRDTHSFFKRGDFKVSYQKFCEWWVSWRKVHVFSTPLGQTKFPGVSDFLFILMLPF